MHLETTTSLELDSTELEDSSLELDSGSEELDSGSIEELDSGSTLELDTTGSSLELDSGTTLELEATELDDSTLELETSATQGVSDHHHVWFASSLIHCGTPSLTRSLFMV